MTDAREFIESVVEPQNVDGAHPRLVFDAAEAAAYNEHIEHQVQLAAVVDRVQALDDGRIDLANEVFNACYGLSGSLNAFYQARLERLMPDRRDLIRWVFLGDTTDQAYATFRGPERALANLSDEERAEYERMHRP